MPLALSLLPLIAQASLAAMPTTMEQAELDNCLAQANDDPPTAIATASEWLTRAHEAEAAFPYQCLGMAYTRLLRWDAAEKAFLSARDVTLPTDKLARGRLGAMAANSALAEGRWDDAIAILEPALADAKQAGDQELSGQVATDLGRAQVGAGQIETARTTLLEARSLDSQNAEAWLLSATLARRLGDLVSAQSDIETTVLLAPQSPIVGLEAGVIAMLSGREEAARKSWQSVLELAETGPEREMALAYLQQLDEAGAEPAHR